MVFVFTAVAHDSPLDEFDLILNVAKMGATFLDTDKNRKVKSHCVRQIYHFKKRNIKPQYKIAVQCLNGWHRSVEITQYLTMYFHT